MDPEVFVFTMNQDWEEREEWMYKPFRIVNDKYRYNSSFIQGIGCFLEFARSQPMYLNGTDIRCPCNRCRNEQFRESIDVYTDLICNGFVKNYCLWSLQGEKPRSKTKETTLVSDHKSNACHSNLDSDEVQEKLQKAKKKRKTKKGITNKWDDDEVQKKSRKAKKNRPTEPEKPGTSIAKHTKESKFPQQHTTASAKEKEVTADSVTCSSIASTSTINSELDTSSLKRVKVQPSKAKGKMQPNCFGVESVYTLRSHSKPRSYEEMQTLLRAQEEEMQQRFLEQEEWLRDKEERLQEKEKELRDKEAQLMLREKNSREWAKKWDLLFPVPLPPTTSTDGNMIKHP